jgi:hypothetical protein
MFDLIGSWKISFPLFLLIVNWELRAYLCYFPYRELLVFLHAHISTDTKRIAYNIAHYTSIFEKHGLVIGFKRHALA